MYKELLEYSKRENIQTEYDFEYKNIHWIVQLDKNGKMSGPSLHNIDVVTENGKTRETVKSLLVPYTDPDYISIPSDPDYYFLFGQPKVLFGECEKESSRAKLKFVLSVLKEIPANPLATSLIKFLNNSKEVTKVMNDLREQKIKDVEWLTFMIDGKLLITDKSLMKFHREYRKKNSRTDITPRRCYLTGEIKPCVDKFTKISSLPKLGAVDLVGLGQDSFTHYGLENVTIGIEEDNLIKWSLYDLCKKGVFCGDVVYIGWTKEKVDHSVGLDLLNYTDPDAVQKLLTSSVKGEEYDLLDTNTYYLYGLSVRSGRLLIVEQYVMSLNQLNRNLQRWFSKMGNNHRSIYQLTKSLEKPSDGTGMKKHIWKNYYRELLKVALLDKPISNEVFNRCFELEIMSTLKDNRPNDTRSTLLNLCLESLDTNSIGYKTGVIFGKYVNLHRLAQVSTGNTGVNFINGMLQGIINRPGYSYGLVRQRFDWLKLFYTKKIDDKFPGRGTELYKELKDSQIAIPGRFDSLSDKTQFLIGFKQTVK